jgi:hypothetical protein
MVMHSASVFCGRAGTRRRGAHGEGCRHDGDSARRPQQEPEGGHHPVIW